MRQLAQTPITGELFKKNSSVSELIPIFIKQGTNNTNMQNYRQEIT